MNWIGSTICTSTLIRKGTTKKIYVRIIDTTANVLFVEFPPWFIPLLTFGNDLSHELVCHLIVSGNTFFFHVFADHDAKMTKSPLRLATGSCSTWCTGTSWRRLCGAGSWRHLGRHFWSASSSCHAHGTVGCRSGRKRVGIRAG